MKKLYFLFSLFLITATAFSQSWTVYNSTNGLNSTGYYFSIAKDNNNNIWVGSTITGAAKFNGTSWTQYSTINSGLPSSDIADIEVDASNNIWFGTYKGLAKYNGSTWTVYDTNNTVMNGMDVYALEFDASGKLWISTKNGSFGNQGVTTYLNSTFTNLTGYPTQLQGKQFNDYAFGTTGTWMATDNGVANYTGTAFNYYPKAVTGLWSSTVVEKDAAGAYWFGGFDGILKYSNGTWDMHTNASLGLGSNTFFYDMIEDNGYMWITSYVGLLKLNMTTFNIDTIYDASNSPIVANEVSGMVKDNNGKIWIAANTKVIKMDPTATGIQENDLSSSFSLYPNPSESICTLNFLPARKGETEIAMYNNLGVLVKSYTEKSSVHQLDIIDLASGVYIVKISSDRGSAFRKLVKN